MSTQEERPSLESRKRRTPRPAADESVDPIDYKPAEASPATHAEVVADTMVPESMPHTSPAAAAPRGRPRREVTLPFSTRLSVDVVDLIDEAVANGEGGGIIRNVVEEAIRARWGRP